MKESFFFFNNITAHLEVLLLNIPNIKGKLQKLSGAEIIQSVDSNYIIIEANDFELTLIKIQLLIFEFHI